MNKRSITFFCTAFYFLLCGFAFSQKINTAVRPAWVNFIEFDFSQSITQNEISSGHSYFLHDMQVNAMTKTEYCHYAYKIFNNKGADDGSKLYFNYNPSYQKLVIHSIRVYRNGEFIDKLKTAHISDLQREENLENNVYNGSRTISAILNDVKSNDIIEYEYSITGQNPIFKNKFYYSFYLNGYNGIKHVSCRIIKPLNPAYHIKYLNTRYQPLVEKKGSTEIITWERTNVEGVKIDDNTPSSYDPYDLVEISEYNNWLEVIEWGKAVFEPQYVPSAALKEKINSFNNMSSRELKTMAALKFVQNEIRYFGIEIGVNSHKPRSPNEVLENGYGDCKDKSLLLCEILKRIGVRAYPVLINTEKYNELDNLIPSPTQFNHAVVMAELKGNYYYFDPTIPNQGGNLNNYFFPNYYYGLVLKDSIEDLARIPTHKNSEIKLQESYNLKSINGDASLHVKTFYMGYDADDMRYRFLNSNVNDIQKKYAEYYEGKYKNVISKQDLTYNDNDLSDIFTTNEKYEIKNIWDDATANEDKLTLTLSGSFIMDLVNTFTISDKTRKDPLAVPFPISRQHIIEIQLPKDWDIQFEEKTIRNGCIKYYRKITYVNNKLTLNYSLKTLAPRVAPENYEEFKSDVLSIKEDLYYSLYWNGKINKQIESSNVNWLLVFMALLITVLVSILFIYQYKKLRQNETNGEVPRSLGGWLILPFIGLCINVVILILNLFVGNFFDKGTWLACTDETSSNYIPGFSSVIIFEMTATIFMIFMSLFLIIITLKSYKVVPKYMVAYYLICLLFAIIDHICLALLIDHTELYYLSKQVVSGMLSAIIWIPFFLYSERSKETFVR